MKQLIDKSEFHLYAKDFLTPWGDKEDIYDIPLNWLYLNKDNGRIASWVSTYEKEHGSMDRERMTRDEWNKILQGYIFESCSNEATARTKKSLREHGQLKVGAILRDGTVVAGNRRVSLLMELYRENPSERYTFFRCAILENPTNEEERKSLKRLETKTQYAEDTPVDYNPIDRLVDIYNSVLVPNPSFTTTEYANTVGLKDGDMKKLINRTEVLIDYLKYINRDMDFGYARTNKLDGPINELAAIYSKCKGNKWVNIRAAFYEKMGQRGDKTRNVRELVKVYKNNPSGFDTIVRTTKDFLLEQPAVTTENAPDDLRSGTEKREDYIQSVDKIITQSKKESARSKPTVILRKFVSNIGSINQSALEVMSEKERSEFFAEVDRIDRIVVRLKALKDKV